MKRILSGITPSGDGTLHIGNYLGAVKQFIDMAQSHECFLFVADLHALTTIQNKETLKKNTETLILQELALLGDLKNITFFRQSDVPVHTECQSIINNVTPLGLIKRAHAYKDKLQKDVMEDDINMGLFSYPVLMAADILLYKPDFVPVGKDQKQHVEIARDIAEKFNKTYKVNTCKLPDPMISDDTAVIVGTDGQRKMSKSIGNIISIFEPVEVIRKQVNGCYTDPTRIHATDVGHIEGNTVFSYLEFFGEKGRVDELKTLYVLGHVSDTEVKEYLFECIMETFKEARVRYEEMKNNPKLVQDILEQGAARAASISQSTLEEMRKAIGITNAYSFFTYPRPSSSKVTIEDFAKIEMKVGRVEKAEHVEKSEKLIRLTVNFGDGIRTIFTGVRQHGYTADDFSGKQFFFVHNLEPRKMMGEESQGMIMAADAVDGKPLFIPADAFPLGSTIR